MVRLSPELKDREVVSAQGAPVGLDFKNLNYWHQRPDLLGRLVRTHLKDPRFSAAMESMMVSGAIPILAQSLLMGYRPEDVPSDSAVFHSDGDQDFNPFSWPMDQDLVRPNLELPLPVLSQKMAIVGDGPAGLLMARLRQELGYPAESTTLFSPSGRLGGIWSQERVAGEGHNLHDTFRPLHFFDGPAFSTQPERPGVEIQNFLSSLIADRSGFQMIKGKVQSLAFPSSGGRYQVDYSGQSSDFDSVFIATGNGVPRRLDQGPLKTNAHLVPRLNTRMKRWQETISREDWPRFQNSTPLIVGLGNSALAILRQFVAMHRAGVQVSPRVLTHLSLVSLEHPSKLLLNQGGDLSLPVSRHRSDLTKLSLDIPSHRDVFEYALSHGWIASSVKEWNVDESAFESDSKVVVSIETVDGPTERIDVTPYIYALIGYQNDSRLMQSLGVVFDPETGRISYDKATCRVKTLFPSDSGRVYVAGAAASVPQDKNRETIPGMGRYMGEIAFSEIVASWAHALRQDIEKGTLAVRRRVGGVVTLYTKPPLKTK